MNRPADVRTSIEAAIQRVLADSGRPAPAMADEDMLFAKLGLDSLDFAQVVVALEQQLGVDPFRISGRPVRTFGDLVQAYRAILESKA